MSEPRVIVALDYPDAKAALHLVDRLEPRSCRVKVGKELFTAAGPQLVEKLTGRGFGVFLDLKFHDIPHTVAQACKVAAKLGVWMLNVHALGGKKMLLAAREALQEFKQRPRLVAVTVLTSIKNEELGEIGVSGELNEAVLRLAGLAHDSGLDGVVCSAQEAPDLRKQFGRKFCLVTAGIRPAKVALGDQQRVTTPRRAMENGADYLVIGRPITQAQDPLKALQEINREIAETVKQK
ncbi:MAG TPA: orotidine-5'-phosphate decarboxylase [Burkholderiales bacterium]|nr:orotidine-5'-phosphate decarboxylase [Burkholderiales bacterium]